MAHFNLEDYEPVQDRIPKFFAKYPDGRIVTKMERYNGTIVFSAALFADKANQVDACPLATGWAEETPGKGYVNQTSALENCETSAIGRALANMGLHGDKRPSREEMAKVQRGDQASNLRTIAERKKHVASLFKRIGLDGEALREYLADKPHDTVEALDHLAIEAQELIDAGKQWMGGEWA